MKNSHSGIFWMLALLLGAPFLSFNAAYGTVCAEEVSTRQGPVTGLQADGLPVCIYRGIPYAAAPIGELRWRPPQEAPARSGVFSAGAFGSQCMQPGMETHLGLGLYRIIGSENCLYLNIFRPARPGKFPVMVWIHGGDLLQGNGSTSIYWGDRLAAANDVIIVTINYRLGPLGYLYHAGLAEEDANHSSGNYGLMDQVKALEWVRDNIENFGGDSGNVTIFGQSAGGWSVCHLLASPLAAGLFERAIIQSGGCECFRTKEQGEEFGREFANRLGCEGREAAACLRSKEGRDVIAALGHDWQKMLALFFPHADGYALMQSPLEAMRSGEYNDVPLMVGTTRDEFKMFSSEIPGGRLLPAALAPRAAENYLSTSLEAGLFDLYRFGDYRRPADALLDATGDAYMGCPNYRAAAASAGHQAKTFYYRFDYDGNLLPHAIGACHGLDVSFVFGTNDRSPSSALYTKGQIEKADELSRTMMQYWINFAKTGNPNGPGLPAWPAYTADKESRLFLDLPVTQGRAEMQEKCGYWDKQDIVVH